jgi:hypothetical protein
MKYIYTNYIHTLLTLPLETCGYIIQGHGDEMIPIVDGVPGHDNRALCTYNPPYKSILWHTHTNNMQSYPSTEDIIKTLKPRNDTNAVLNSLIFTKWGIWEFNAENKGIVNENIKHVLNSAYSGLYHVTEKGRGKLNSITIQFLQGYIEELKYILSGYNFNIYFTQWENLRNNNIYYLRN